MDKAIEFFSNGLRLKGVLRHPAGFEPSRQVPAVVMCQGFSLTKEVWMTPFAKALNDAGYLTLSLDYSTFGESEGQPRCRLVPWMQVEDVRNALTFLETLPEVRPAALGLFGVSLGASVAVAVAGTDARVAAMVAAAGPGDLNRVWSVFPGYPTFYEKIRAARRAFVSTGKVSYIALTRLLASDPEECAMVERDAPSYPGWRPEVTFESLHDLVEFRPEDEAPNIRGASLYIYAQNDVLISPFEVQSLYSKTGGPKELFCLEKLPHPEIYGEGKGFAPMVERSLRFFAVHLPLTAGAAPKGRPSPPPGGSLPGPS